MIAWPRLVSLTSGKASTSAMPVAGGALSSELSLLAVCVRRRCAASSVVGALSI